MELHVNLIFNLVVALRTVEAMIDLQHAQMHSIARHVGLHFYSLKLRGPEGIRQVLLDVLVQVALHGEGHRALDEVLEWALKRLLLRVRPKVVLQVMPFPEDLATAWMITVKELYWSLGVLVSVAEYPVVVAAAHDEGPILHLGLVLV